MLSRVAIPAPSSPSSRFRFRSAFWTMPPQTRLPAPPGAKPLRSWPPASPAPGPAAPTPGTYPPLGTCWPPWPFPPPPPPAQRGPGGSLGQGSKRSPERGAAASQKSQSGPRSRHLRRLSRRGSSRPALSSPPLPPLARDAEAGAGPLGFFRKELGSRRTGARLLLPPRSPSPARRWTRRAAAKACPARLGVRLLPEHLRRIRRTRPSARLRSENETSKLGYFRKKFGSPRPTAARRSVISVAARPLPRGRGEELGLTLSSPECCSSACGRERLEAPLRFSELFASGFARYLHERSTLPHPFRIPLFLPPHPHKGPRRPAAPHKKTGR